MRRAMAPSGGMRRLLRDKGEEVHAKRPHYGSRCDVRRGGPGSTSQLVQAMAGFGGGAADTSNTVPLGADTSQQ
jgi:hypothetical protein